MSILPNIAKRIYYSLIRLKMRIMLEQSLLNIKTRRRYRNSFKSLKNIHKGKRCFIIGNGPSLTSEDLTLLKEEYTFAANRIFYIFNKTPWRPTYYCAQDDVVIQDIADKFEAIEPEVSRMFLISESQKIVSSNVIKSDKVQFFCAEYVSAHKHVGFSEKIEDHICGGGTITYAAIQIAAYMGFSEIYLLGVDHNYASSSFKDNNVSADDVAGSYFEGMPTNIKMTKPNTDNSTRSFIKAKEYGDSHGIKIYNSTRGGKLEVFPRKTLEEVIEHG